MKETTMQRKNIGNIGRRLLRQILGTVPGQAAIDAAELGILPALGALIRGDYRSFMSLMPKDLLDGLIAYVQATAISRTAAEEFNN
jgi:hypothetical protein